jgi:hypothetical protein
MRIRYGAICAGALLAAVALQSNAAYALSTTECSAKYKAAKEAGTLNGMTWNQFRKAQCGSDAGAAPAPGGTPAAAAKPATPAAGAPVFPSTVDAKYSKETAYKQRWHTCLDQYHANKAKNANGGLNWIQKGGGYWSQCNKRLKGEA